MGFAGSCALPIPFWFRSSGVLGRFFAAAMQVHPEMVFEMTSSIYRRSLNG
jgi:integral membrane sensor domain MASE1